MELTNIEEIRALLSRRGFRFSKTLGQNFLCAKWVPERIVEGSGVDRDTGVLEIGPGVGCLTRELSAAAGRVVSVELDKSLRPVLAETLTGCDNVEVLFADILKTDICELADREFSGCGRRSVCANLPYNITTPVLTALIASNRFDDMTVMIQREVAQRCCARENTPEYGAFSVFIQWHCSAAVLFDVPPSCFIPAPKVTSAVIRLEKRAAPPARTRDERLMFDIVRAAFNQRRKTLANALANALGDRFSKPEIAEALAKCSLDGRIRGEALSIAKFAELTDALSK